MFTFAPYMGIFRVYRRLLLLTITMLYYLSQIALRMVFKGYDMEHAFAIRMKWTQRAITILGIELDIHRTSQYQPSNCLYISNHRSMIDPVIILSEIFALPVAKAEIANYPLVGSAAKITGIIYLERENKTSRWNTREAIKEKIADGLSILLFPEGTTGNQPHTKIFRKGSFEIAADEHIPIIPLCIEYGHPDNLWSDGDGLFKHFAKSFRHRKIRVKLYIGEAMRSNNSWTLLRDTQNWIDQRLKESQESMND